MSPENEALSERMDGDYEAPVLAEPTGGPVPEWDPPPDEPDA